MSAILPSLKGWPSILLARAGAAKPADLKSAVSAGAFEGLRRAVRELGPEGTIAEVQASGLRGRGGAGHLTADKWRAAAETPAKSRYVVANGYGADPSASTDRTLIETDPYAVVEGVAIAAFTIGAETGYISVRSTASKAIRGLEAAIEAATAHNYIGEDALGSGRRVEIEVRPVQGAYMLGEETVLLKALDGKRGQPEQRPPHPATRGFRNAPTVVQNVQTLASVPWILRHRAKAFEAIGLGDAPGTILVDVRGHATSGVAEVPLGTPLEQIVALGGKPASGRSLKAVVVGGPTGGILPPSELNTPYTFADLRGVGAHIGSGSVIVADDRACIVDLARLLTRFSADEACGKTIPCRIGVRRIAEIGERLSTGTSRGGDVQLLQDLCADVVGSALCDHERLATLPMLSSLRYFRDELDAHLLRGECPGWRLPSDQARSHGMTDLIERPSSEVTPIETPAKPGGRTVAEHPMGLSETTGPNRQERANLPRRLDPRPESRPDQPIKRDTTEPMEDSHAERLLTTQAPQRPQSTPRIRIEVDGRTVEGLEGQTILEVCRDNGIEIPTLCYEPKLPGFGACRMCVVEVEGEDHPPISCSRSCEDGMKVQTQTEEIRRLRRTNLELIFSDHNAYCLPPCQNKCPSHIDIPGFLKQNAEGNFRESTRIFKRTIPFPSVLGRVCPAPCEDHCRRDEVDEAIAIRDSHRYAGDMVIKSMLDEDLDPPIPFEQQPATGRRAAVIGSGPAGMAAAYYLLLSGHDVTVYERDPAPGGMLRYGIPQYRLPKVEVLEAEYESVTRLGGKIVCNQGLGTDFTLDDLQYQGFDAVVIAIGCYDTNKLGIPGEDAPEVLDGLEYLRTATLGLPYPNHQGKRVVVIGGGFTSMDCSRTSIRQGAKEVTLVYRRDMKDMPASNEVHEAIEEGVTAIFQAGPVRVITDKSNNVTGVEFIRMALGAPDASGRRRPEPAPGTEFTIPCDRVLLAIGQGPELTWMGPGSQGTTATKNRRLQADAVTFETGRTGVFATGDVRIGAATVVQAIAEGRRAAYAVDAFLRGNDLSTIRTRQTLAEPQPEFLSIVPFTAEVKEPRYRMKAMEAEERNRNYVEYEIPYSREEIVAESTRCLQCTCEAIGYCDLRRLGIEYGTTLTTLEPNPHEGAGLRSVNENRFTGINHDYVRDDSHAFILREPSRCIDCGRCAQVCSEVVGAACYDFMRIGFDTLVTTPLDMSLNDTPCVSCGRCAETCPTGALMPKPRVLQKYEVDESRCILCGICVDACPYDALRDGGEFELAHSSREEPMIDLMAMAQVDRETEVTYIRKERDWLQRAIDAGRYVQSDRLLTVLPATLSRDAGNGHGNGNGTGHAHDGSHGESHGGTHARLK